MRSRLWRPRVADTVCPCIPLRSPALEAPLALKYGLYYRAALMRLRYQSNEIQINHNAKDRIRVCKQRTF